LVEYLAQLPQTQLGHLVHGHPLLRQEVRRVLSEEVRDLVKEGNAGHIEGALQLRAFRLVRHPVLRHDVAFSVCASQQAFLGPRVRIMEIKGGALFL
jgi:hypothetical protein